jgi:SAM-dependent methyltransferase
MTRPNRRTPDWLAPANPQQFDAAVTLPDDRCGARCCYVRKPMAGLLETNRRIAQGYELSPWEQGYPTGLDPSSLFDLAKPYGSTAQLHDALDLGCGTGALLAAAAAQMDGRMVGVDISARSCMKAREALAPYGDRAEIIACDLLELTKERLGSFDVIYCTGVLYVVPALVREHLLELIAACLKPGGIALISYYAGSRSAIAAQLGRSLRLLTAESQDPLSHARAAREMADQLRSAIQRQGHFSLSLRAAFRHVDVMSDNALFAELLNGYFDSMSTGELNRVLQARGVEFATYLDWSGFRPCYSATDRALLADRLDLAGGSYYYAVFVKRPGDSAPSPEAQPPRPGPDEFPLLNYTPRRSLRRKARRIARHLFWRVFKV